jgi:hypothetical protein
MNKDAVIARTKLKDLHNLYMQSKIQEHRDIHKAYKKEYNIILKTAKANYIQNIITRSNSTSKVLWEFVNRERGILTGNIHLQVGNEIVTSPSRTCNIFNKTFLETVSKLMLDENPPQTSNNILSVKDSLVLSEITETELIKIIQSMKNKKSAGLENISPYLPKKMCTSHNKAAVRTGQCIN